MAVVGSFKLYSFIYILLSCSVPILAHTPPNPGGPGMCPVYPLPALHLHLTEDNPTAGGDPRLWEGGV